MVREVWSRNFADRCLACVQTSPISLLHAEARKQDTSARRLIDSTYRFKSAIAFFPERLLRRKHDF